MPALPPLATVADLAGWLRVSFTSEDETWAGLVLDAVSGFVRSAAGRPWADGDVPATARAVTLEVAARVWRNPEAASTRSLTTGPFGQSVTWANPTKVGLYLTDDDRKALGIRGTRGLFTLATTRGEPCDETGWVPVAGSENPFPWYAGDVP